MGYEAVGVVFPSIYYFTEVATVCRVSFNGLMSVAVFSLIISTFAFGSNLISNFVFSILFVIEIVIKFVANMQHHNHLRYFYRVTSWIDLSATAVMCFLVIKACESHCFTAGHSENKALVNVVAASRLVRALRIVKLTSHLEKFMLLVRTFARILPVILPYFALCVAVYLIFGGIGKACFAGKITQVVADGGPGLWDTAPWNTTAFGQAPHYHLLNFDDTFSASITLWVLLIQNNWHVVAEGYQLVLGTRWTRLYFTSYNVVVQVMMLSMLIGVIINQFSKITEDETLKAKGQERPEMVFMDEIRNRLALATAPSGKQYMELWEVYEDDSLLGSEMKHDQNMVLQRNTISHSNAQVLLNTVGTPIIGRTEDGFVCYANQCFLELCCHGSKLNQVVDTEFKTYFSADIHALAQRCQGTTGSFLWHDVTSTLERQGFRTRVAPAVCPDGLLCPDGDH